MQFIDLQTRIVAAILAIFFAASHAGAAPNDQIDDVVQTVMQEQQVPGVAIAVISKGDVTVRKGYGFANVELTVEATPETIFQSGSVGKQFTVAAIMLQVEDGKLALDDPITKYFTNAPKSWHQITVRHLLTHTSGIADYANDRFDYWRNYTEDELAKIAYGLKLEFKPGTRWNYSNTGYMLLGILVRKISGKFYGEVLKERVFAPLGMKTARVISEADIILHRAAGYRLVKGELKNQEWVAPGLNTTADGSLYLTVLDLIAWDKGLRSRAILKPESWEQIFKPVTLASGKTYPYGFGWSVDDYASQPTHAHTGHWQGFSAAISRYLRSDLTVIALGNNSFDVGGLANAIAAKVNPALIVPKLTPIPDTEPAVTGRLKLLLERAAKGTLLAGDFVYMPAGWFRADKHVEMLRPLGALTRLDLLQRREMGDDWVYLYEAVYQKGKVRVRFALAPNNGVSQFALSESKD